MKFKFFTLALGFIGLVTFLTSCGDKYITVPYTRPAQVNMKEFKALFIADFIGENGSKITFELKKLLLNMKRFDILESFNAARNTNAAAVIEGDVVMDEYGEKVKEGSQYKDDKGNTHRDYSLEGRWDTNVNIKISDIKSSKIIYAANTEKSSFIKRTEKDRRPVVDKYVKNDMMNDAHKLIAQSIVNLILPSTEYVSVRMMNDDDLPELESGIEFAKKGDFEQAIEVFRRAVDKTKDKEKLAMVYYNIGICYQYSYKFDEARSNLNMASSLYEDDLYKNAIPKLEKMQSDYEEYLRQL
jgi:tetratricopeptide (TPR) repeat protein